jgi:hypothetical protein
VGAADVVLDGDVLARIEALAPRGSFAGDRYPDMRPVAGVSAPPLDA